VSPKKAQVATLNELISDRYTYFYRLNLPNSKGRAWNRGHNYRIIIIKCRRQQ